jgi:NitT/TauT family transport system substrate-binding protein
MPRTLAAAVAMAAAAVLLSGCHVFGSAAPPAPEKPDLTVAVVPAIDSAGFFIALHDGLFTEQGLNVNYVPATSSDTVIAAQMAGEYDITAGNYVSYIEAAAEHHDALQIIAEGSVMAAGSQAIYTLPNSPVKTLAQLRGRVLGLNAPLNVNYLLSASVLTEHGISPSAVRYPAGPVQFPDLVAELGAGKVAAAALPEPFATLAEEKLGAVELADCDQGATADFPVLGYVVTKAWAARYPRTLAAFLRALEQGQEIADTSRAAVEQAMEALPSPQDGQVPPVVAAVMALDTYPLGTDAARLQRVPDVMLQFGLLRKRFDIRQMLG